MNKDFFEAVNKIPYIFTISQKKASPSIIRDIESSGIASVVILENLD